MDYVVSAVISSFYIILLTDTYTYILKYYHNKFKLAIKIFSKK